MRTSIQSQLESAGLLGQVYKRGGEMLVLCPFHDDHKASMSVNLQSGAWYCYTEARGGTFVELFEVLRRDADWGEGKPQPYQAQQVPMLRSWAERGFTTPMLVKWGIEWDTQVNAMRIPVLDDEGNVTANIWRAPQGVEPPYTYPTGWRKSECLFGLWRLPPECPQMVLVEGPLDAIWVQEATLPCVAILGSSLSEKQVALLVERHVRKGVLCFDNDDAGRRATEEARDLLRRAGMWVHRVPLPQQYNDIQEVPHGKVAALIARATLYTRRNVVHPRQQRWLGGASASSGVWRRSSTNG